MDVDASLPKIKGNFKGSHSAVFQVHKAKVIPMTEEESVEDLFRSLDEKKSSTAAAAKEDIGAKAETVEYGSSQVVLSGYLGKEGRGRFATWNKR